MTHISPSCASRASILLVLATLLLWLPWLGLSPFATRGEPREALVAQAMMASENYVLPRVYGGDVPSKPPFLHWLIVGASKIAGGDVTELTARLPSAVMACLVVVGFSLFVAQSAGGSVGILTGMLLATNIEWWRAASTCRVDMLLAGFTLFAIIAAFESYTRGTRAVGYLLAVMLAGSGAVLTKGPVGVALPILAVSIYFFSEAPRQWFRIGLWATVVVLASLGIPALWYLAAYQEGGSDFIAKVFSENLQRLSSTMEDSPHKHSVFYLVGTIILGFMPWTLPVAAQGYRQLRTAGLRAGWRATSPLIRLSFVVIATFTTFYAIPESKRSVYLLPIYPFLSFLAAHTLLSSSLSVVSTRLLRLVALFLVIVLGVGALFVALPDLPIASWDLMYVRETLRGLSFGIFVALGVVWFGALTVLFGTTPGLSRLYRLVVVWWGLLVVLAAGVLPAIRSPLSEGRLANDIRQLSAGQQLSSFQREFYGVSFYLQQSIARFDPMRIENDQGLILIKTADEDKLRAVLNPSITLTERYRSTFGVGQPTDRVSLFEYRKGSLAHE